MTADDHERSAHELTMHIARTTKALRGAMATEMARFGCQPPQNLVLDALASGDSLTPGELARLLGVSGPTAVKMAQRMEANGLVVRRRDDPDERLVRIYLTEQGRELQGLIAAAVDHIAEAAVTGLDEQDKEAVGRILGVVRDNVARYAGDRAHSR